MLLADALTFSQESQTKHDFIIDFATLTGAARVALGTELPALFTNNEQLGNDIINVIFSSINILLILFIYWLIFFLAQIVFLDLIQNFFWFLNK